MCRCCSRSSSSRNQTRSASPWPPSRTHSCYYSSAATLRKPLIVRNSFAIRQCARVANELPIAHCHKIVRLLQLVCRFQEVPPTFPKSSQKVEANVFEYRQKRPPFWLASRKSLLLRPTTIVLEISSQLQQLSPYWHRPKPLVQSVAPWFGKCRICQLGQGLRLGFRVRERKIWFLFARIFLFLRLCLSEDVRSDACA